VIVDKLEVMILENKGLTWSIHVFEGVEMGLYLIVFVRK
jgi:hypothetical protein